MILLKKSTPYFSLPISGHGLSASYTTLLTWLLSLVPDDFSFLQSASPPPSQPSPSPLQQAPFHVVGLQQVYVSGQLCLYVAVVPSQQFSLPAKSRKQKVRK